MKSLLFSLGFLVVLFTTYAQDAKKGKVITKTILAPSIQGNKGGEDPVRRLTIYLPPGYETSVQNYPVIYFLHGYLVDDSLMFAAYLNSIDAAIANKQIRPTILVLPNSNNRFKGSLYTNSTLTGNWADFIGKDVVQYMDKNFRTIANKNSRGMAGHSSGGNGALKMAMLYPDTFGALYTLSAANLNWGAEFNLNNPSFKVAATAKNEEELFKPLQLPFGSAESTEGIFALFLTAAARAYSPAQQKPPFHITLPVTYVGDSMVINANVVKQWEANFPINMIESHLGALKSLNGFKMDWGRNENYPHIQLANIQFSKKLEVYGVNHFAEEYIGDHFNKLGD